MKTGTAPDSMTTWVCSDVPEAMFVKAHAASNCKRECAFVVSAERRRAPVCEREGLRT